MTLNLFEELLEKASSFLISQGKTNNLSNIQFSKGHERKMKALFEEKKALK